MRPTLLLSLLALPLLAQEGPQTLKPGAPVTRTLAPGQVHRYTVPCRKGEYRKVVAMQKGVDLVLTAFAPDGKKLAEVDSPNGSYGPERFAFEATQDGAYRVDIACLEEGAKPGAYEVRIPFVVPAAEYASHRMVDLTRAQAEALRGNYEVEPGRVVMVGVVGGVYLGKAGPALFYEDLATRETGVLHSTSPTAAFRGRTLSEPFPVGGEVAFTLGPGGRAKALTWQDARGRVLNGRKVDPLRLEEVAVPSGNLTLKGYLMLPEGKGPWPVAVFAHGSGAGTRDLGPNGNFFVRHGVGLLALDKRGAGESTGKWETATLRELAGDVLAGVAWLRLRKDVDPARIGVWGISQGGWVSSIAAGTSRDVAFQISQVGSGVPVWENMVHEKRSELQAAGFPAAEVDEACAFAARIYRMMSEGAAPAAVHAEAKQVAARPWLPMIGMALAPPENYMWNWMKLNGMVDSLPYLKGVNVPVLWLLADKDSQVPAERSQALLKQALARNPAATLRVLSPANHGMMECTTCFWDEALDLTRIVPGYRDVLGTWLDRVVANRR